MEEWNEFCERENISYLKDRVTIRYFDNKPPIGPRFIVETPSEKDVFKLVNNHQGTKIEKIPVQFGPYFDKYKPPILVVGFNLPPTWDTDRIIKLTSRAGAESQQNFPEKVTGCNSWGKKVLPFGALLLELPVDL